MSNVRGKILSDATTIAIQDRSQQAEALMRLAYYASHHRDLIAYLLYVNLLNQFLLIRIFVFMASTPNLAEDIPTGYFKALPAVNKEAVHFLCVL